MIEIASLIKQNRTGTAVGLPSFCTANEHVLRAILEYAAEHQVPALIEATCNQVNQDGGYTGLTPADFVRWVTSLADEYRVASDAVVLGGDHLGPNPWRHLAAEQAMQKAEVLVRDYAAAGFRKLHLDASMACGGEPTPSFELVAERAARLCQIAEKHAPEPQGLIYVIGTEVPIPGGETGGMDELSVTDGDRLQQTIDTHHDAFERAGLQDALPRIVSIVTQPGVDFSHTSVRPFNPSEATDLSQAILKFSGMTFEAHSTDYQASDALADLVSQHFFFLKVGPELTFRMREAVFALASIEKLLQPPEPSNLVAVIDQAMDEDRSNWEAYYQGSPDAVKQLRHYSYSDRIRYYWTVPKVKQALNRLVSNLDKQSVPETIVSQHFPTRAFGTLDTNARALISDHIRMCIQRYYQACGY